MLFFILQKFSGCRLIFRRWRYWYFFKRTDVYIGHGVRVLNGRGRHSFGKNLQVFDRVIFEVYGAAATISIGDNCRLSYGVLINCTTRITLGHQVWIGEYTSLRDATHDYSAPLGSKRDKHAAIQIGDNVWIGRGSLVLPGSVIEDNVVVAAHAVVKGRLQANGLYGGCPAKRLKQLDGFGGPEAAQQAKQFFA